MERKETREEDSGNVEGGAGIGVVERELGKGRGADGPLSLTS